MTANDTPPAAPDSTANAAPPPSPPPHRRAAGNFIVAGIAVAALLLAGWAGWQERGSRQQLAELRAEAASRLSEAADASTEERGAREQLQAQVGALQTRLAAAEEHLAEFASQGDALQTLYDNLARGREDIALLEVEQALALAAQQLQLTGNVPVAVLALHTADAHLARLDKPRYLPLRGALARDLARLEALPTVDVAGISLRLEDIILHVDGFALAALDRPAPAAAPAADETAAPGSWWRLAAADAWRELRDLVRIQRFDHEEAALLAPEQNFFLRENLKLRLLNARLALLSHDQETFRGELKMAQDWLKRHFSAGDPAVQAAQENLRQALAANPHREPPGLDDSLTALASVQAHKKAGR